MAEKPADLRDPMQMAVAVTELRGLFGQTQQQLISMGQNLSGAVQSLQMTQEQMRQDMKVVAEKITSIDTLQHEQRAHSSGIERAHAELENFIREAREQRTIDRAEDEKIRSKITRISSFSLGLSFAVSMLVALVVYIYVTDKTNNQRDFDELRERQYNHEREADLRQDRIEAKLIEFCALQHVECPQFR